MRGKRFSEEQIIGIINEWKNGFPISELARKHGVCDNTLYRWKGKCAGKEVSDAKRLKPLEDENRRFKPWRFAIWLNGGGGGDVPGLPNEL